MLNHHRLSAVKISTMKKSTTLILFLLAFLQMSCSENEPSEVLTEPYVGTWQIRSVSNDRALQSEWSDAVLILEQTNELGGTYELPATPYDTIWNSNGTWKSVDEESFLLNDSIVVSYLLNNDSLYLIKTLPWTDTTILCNVNDPEIEGCPLGLAVGGLWVFFLTK